MECLRAQGATEYLVLLAVVLIVALVSVALLGFFPGMASDAQITQSRIYWSGASPIAITESAARAMTEASPLATVPYLRIKNNGVYPIRITGLFGADGIKTTRFSGYGCGLPGDNTLISDYFYMAPGEEKYFSSFQSWYGPPCTYAIFAAASTSTSSTISATSLCQNSTTSPGVLQFSSFGFEYIEYIDGQQITKREMGKPLIIKCMEPMIW